MVKKKYKWFLTSTSIDKIRSTISFLSTQHFDKFERTFLTIALFLCRRCRARTSPVFEEPPSRHERLHDLRGQHDSPRLLGDGGMADPQQTYLRNSARGECWSSLPSFYIRLNLYSSLDSPPLPLFFFSFYCPSPIGQLVKLLRFESCYATLNPFFEQKHRERIYVVTDLMLWMPCICVE